MTLSRDPAKAREWQDRSRATAMAKGRKAPQDRRPERKRIKPQSAKRQREAVIRRQVVRDMIRAFPYCQAQWVCVGARAVTVHERLKRSRGGSHIDPVQSHAITICDPCHRLTEERVAEATSRRLLIPSWHRCPEGEGPC